MSTPVVSFDFDDTLATETSYGWGGSVQVCIPLMLNLLKEYHAMGCECIILTARSDSEDNNRDINDFIATYGLKDIIKKVIYTNHCLKGPFAIEHKVSLHYDDCQNHIGSLKEAGISVVDSIKAVNECVVMI